MRKVARARRNLSKQSFLLNEQSPGFSPAKKSIFADRRTLQQKTDFIVGKSGLDAVDIGGSPLNWPLVSHQSYLDSKERLKRQKTLDFLEDNPQKDMHRLGSD